MWNDALVAVVAVMAGTGGLVSGLPATAVLAILGIIQFLNQVKSSSISDKNYRKNCYLGNFMFLPPSPF